MVSKTFKYFYNGFSAGKPVSFSTIFSIPKKAWENYKRLLRTRPIITNSLTSSVVAGIGDIIAQKLVHDQHQDELAEEAQSMNANAIVPNAELSPNAPVCSTSQTLRSAILADNPPSFLSSTVPNPGHETYRESFVSANSSGKAGDTNGRGLDTVDALMALEPGSLLPSQAIDVCASCDDDDGYDDCSVGPRLPPSSVFTPEPFEVDAIRMLRMSCWGILSGGPIFYWFKFLDNKPVLAYQRIVLKRPPQKPLDPLRSKLTPFQVRLLTLNETVQPTSPPQVTIRVKAQHNRTRPLRAKFLRRPVLPANHVSRLVSRNVTSGSSGNGGSNHTMNKIRVGHSSVARLNPLLQAQNVNMMKNIGHSHVSSPFIPSHTVAGTKSRHTLTRPAPSHPNRQRVGHRSSTRSGLRTTGTTVNTNSTGGSSHSHSHSQSQSQSIASVTKAALQSKTTSSSASASASAAEQYVSHGLSLSSKQRFFQNLYKVLVHQAVFAPLQNACFFGWIFASAMIEDHIRSLDYNDLTISLSSWTSKWRTTLLETFDRISQVSTSGPAVGAVGGSGSVTNTTAGVSTSTSTNTASTGSTGTTTLNGSGSGSGSGSNTTFGSSTSTNGSPNGVVIPTAEALAAAASAVLKRNSSMEASQEDKQKEKEKEHDKEKEKNNVSVPTKVTETTQSSPKNTSAKSASEKFKKKLEALSDRLYHKDTGFDWSEAMNMFLPPAPQTFLAADPDYRTDVPINRRKKIATVTTLHDPVLPISATSPNNSASDSGLSTQTASGASGSESEDGNPSVVPQLPSFKDIATVVTNQTGNSVDMLNPMEKKYFDKDILVSRWGDKLVNDVAPVTVLALFVMGPVQMFNQYCKPEYRALIQALAFIGWSSYLSIVGHKTKNASDLTNNDYDAS